LSKNRLILLEKTFTKYKKILKFYYILIKIWKTQIINAHLGMNILWKFVEQYQKEQLVIVEKVDV
jgi:hypothetical protein